MAIINMDEKPESQIEPLPIGTYPGVISAIWNIGKQKKEWQGDVSIIDQMMVRVEVSKTISAPGSEFDGKRYAPISWITIPKAYHEKAGLVKLAASALGKNMTAEDFKQFDTDTLIGKNVVVSIGHTSGGKAKITGFSPAMDGMPLMTPELPQDMPDWVKDKVDSALKEDGAQQQQQSQRLVPPVQPELSVPDPSMDKESLPF